MFADPDSIVSLFQVAFNRSGDYLVATSYGVADILRLQYNPAPPRPDKPRFPEPVITKKDPEKRDGGLRPHGSAASTNSRRRSEDKRSPSHRGDRDRDRTRDREKDRDRDRDRNRDKDRDRDRDKGRDRDRNKDRDRDRDRDRSKYRDRRR